MQRISRRPRGSSQSKMTRLRRDDAAIAHAPQHEQEQDDVSQDEQLIGAERYARKGDDVIWDDRF